MVVTRNPEPRENRTRAVRRLLRRDGYADNLSEDEMLMLVRVAAMGGANVSIEVLADAVKKMRG